MIGLSLSFQPYYLQLSRDLLLRAQAHRKSCLVVGSLHVSSLDGLALKESSLNCVSDAIFTLILIFTNITSERIFLCSLYPHFYF